MSSFGFNGLLVLLLLFPRYLGSVILKDSYNGFLNTSNSLDFVERAKEHGYEAEKHSVVTEDGYVLTLFRITRRLKCQEPRKTPVLLMHGLLLDADGWLDSGPNAGLAYLLADACWDTWVGNVRGSSYSRRHILLDPDRNKEFWRFSVDEIGQHDIPSMIDYVLQAARVRQLNYIGFSQGSGTFFIMCSEKPGYCDKVKGMIALAPATTNFNTKSLMFKLICQTINRYRKTIEDLGIWEIFAKGLPTYEIFRNVCKDKGRGVSNFCRWVLSLFDAHHELSISDKTIRGLFEHFPVGTSVQNMARYGQSTLRQEFVKFDYGVSKNKRLYGSAYPPAYDLSAVNIPVVVIYGKNDGLVDEKDVKWLVRKLPNVKELIAVKDPQWTHLDLVYSKHMKTMVFPDIQKYLLQFNWSE